jgi:hypothetical protein
MSGTSTTRSASSTEKWDCASPRQLIQLLNARALYPCDICGDRCDCNACVTSAHRAFYLACHLDDVKTAILLLPIAAQGHYDDDVFPYPGPVHPGITDASLLDVTGMAICDIEALPRPYFYALLRASHGRASTPQVTWDGVAVEFKKLVGLLSEYFLKFAGARVQVYSVLRSESKAGTKRPLED